MPLFLKSRLKNMLYMPVLLLGMGNVRSQTLNLIPYPQKVVLFKGHCVLNKSILFTSDPELAGILPYFNTAMGWNENTNGVPGQMIDLKIIPSANLEGSYDLETFQTHVRIVASGRAGLFNGLVTLLQLYKSAGSVYGKLVLPRVVIHDQPRFAWRGFLLDESRHFFGKKEVKKILNWMAFYKLNRFHWHLTDSQGWRLEIKKYPLLSTIGGRGNFTDPLAEVTYYTQEDIREIVSYATERCIGIIPEIDMPGHATAANRAYPIFSGGSTPGYPDFTFNPGVDSTYSGLSDILKEVKLLFPSRIIHIGGDEVALGIRAWEKNQDVIGMMTMHQLTDLNQVESYFLKRIADSVIKSGSEVMCWDEAVSANLPVKRTYIDWWRQDKPEQLEQAITKGYRVILCPRLPLYFDFVQNGAFVSGRKWGEKYNDYTQIYHFPENDIPAKWLDRNNILGLQANLWTETVCSEKRLEFLIFPRMAALSEAAWTEASLKNDTAFNVRLKTHLLFYKQQGIYYYDPFQPAGQKEQIDFVNTKD